MKKNNITTILIIVFSFMIGNIQAQLNKKPQNLPFADQKMYHLGFQLGIHTQDMVFSHTGHTAPNGQAWFAEIPGYDVGLSVGILGDRYLNEYFNLRLSPTLHFGEKKFVFKEQITGKEYENSVKSSYLTTPLHLKFSGKRNHNFRPYLLAGVYGAWDLTNKKNAALRFKTMDYGLDFGVGFNLYLPLFKLSPELRFSLGLADAVDTDTSDLTDQELLPYRQAVSSGKTRMISLIFNFE